MIGPYNFMQARPYKIFTPSRCSHLISNYSLLVFLFANIETIKLFDVDHLNLESIIKKLRRLAPSQL